MSLIKNWSYSAFQTWSSCAAKYKYSRIDRLPEPPSPAMERGNSIHLKCESYLKGTLYGMPPEMEKFREEFQELKARGAVAEQDWAFDRSWEPVPWKEGWLRGKADAHLVEGDTLYIVDFKTGGIYDAHKSQGELYSVMGYCMYPEVKNFHVEFWYLDKDSLGNSPFTYSLKTVKKMGARWNERALQMMDETEFNPYPSKDGCRWCPFRSDKTLANGEPGPCDGWKEVE